MEQIAAKTARGASAGIDGMTARMVKGATAGNLIADAIKKAVEWTKSWTIEAAKMAAHELRMEASGRALAKAHGIAADAFEKAVEAVRKIGYHGEEAIHTIDRLIIADLDLSKAEGLAKVAKDAAAIEDIAAPEALEKILQAIEFGNARALRSAGLVVNFEREITTQELLLGRTLSDNEKVQARYNAVMKAAAAIQGAHAGAVGEAEMQMKALDREVHELREAVGAPPGAYSFSSQPLRRYGLRYLLASSLLVKRMFLESHSSLPGTRNATAPRISHSMYLVVTANSDTPGAPPLQARIQSCWWLIPRCSSCGGSL
jgi:hypothetical protein